MDRKETLSLLRGGFEGVAEWNRRRRLYEQTRQLDCSVVPLDGVDLAGADLYGADLHEVNFHRANFSDACLVRAHLEGADLSQAFLPGANLRFANLDRADLSKADLTGAVLRGTYLGCANLEGTILSMSRVSWATFNGSLDGVIGLDTVRYGGPSAISVQSIRESKRGLPEGFLRGCGLTDFEIQTLSSLASSPIEFYSCFISYSSADKLFAQRLSDALQDKGVRCWLDEHQILPGDDIYDQVHRGIEDWDKTLLCCSRNSLEKSWWVHKELERAFAKEQRIQKERGSKALALIPLNLDGFLFEWDDGKAETVKARHAQDFTGWDRDPEKFEKALERTVRALRTDAGGRENPPPSKL